jgi:hypothetical protein
MFATEAGVAMVETDDDARCWPAPACRHSPQIACAIEAGASNDAGVEATNAIAFASAHYGAWFWEGVGDR